ncbi:tyrosine--tRNA ligase, mitochondrial-like [Saccoglossus kowalevskii]
MAAPIGVRACNRLSRYVGISVIKRRSCQVHAILSRSYTNSNILTLQDRGIFHEIFPAECEKLPQLLTSSPQTIYCGVDPTADSLHIGNLLALISLIHCQRAGHNAIALIGNATALVGDPSGKTKEREPLSKEIVNSNSQSIQESLNRVFSNHERCIWKKDKKLPPIQILHNMSWYENKKLIDFLSSAGRHFRLGTMLSKHSVKTRLNSSEGMNLTEFLYQVFQSYDFYHLHKKYGCNIQLGGTDQLGNIMAGHDLIHRVTGKETYGILIPLVTSTEGDKLGKSAGNAIWINPDKTTPFELFQNKPDNRTAQRKLAEQVTLLVHGDEGLNTAVRFTNALYSGSPETLEKLSEKELKELFKNAPSTTLTLEPGITMLDLGKKVNSLPSTGVQGERIIQEGGFYVNYRKITNPDQILLLGDHILKNDLTLLRVGKKNYHIVKWVY